MRFTKIDLANIRVIEHAILKPEPGINILFGDNGSGKTSVLEALHTLSRGKSFRTPRIDELIRRNQSRMYISAHIEHETKGQLSIGLIREQKKTQVVFDQTQVKTQSEQATNIPVLVQTTDTHNLIFGIPKQRRKWLDWVLFHVEPSYLDYWKRYHNALRSRNILLRKQAKETELAVWEKEMASHGKQMITLCNKTLGQLETQLSKRTKTLLGQSASLRYCSGWDDSTGYAETLKQQRKGDVERGYTRYGPHRADVDLMIEQEKASKILSRGQAKLYLAALLLSEAQVLMESTYKKPVVLIDDVAAELDQASRNKIIRELKEIQAQSFITTTELEKFEDIAMTAFHVKQGHINVVKS